MAEGVETPDEVAFLRAHECDEAQGFYFSRPVPAPAFADLLRSGVTGGGVYVPHLSLGSKPEKAAARAARPIVSTPCGASPRLERQGIA